MARIGGKSGALYVNNGSGWAWVSDLYDWAAETELVTLDASIKGDTAQRNVTSHTRGKLTAKRYVQSITALAAYLTPGVRLDFAVVAIDPAMPAGPGSPGSFSTNANLKIQGTGYVTSSHVNAPRGAMADDMELTFDTVPVIV